MKARPGTKTITIKLIPDELASLDRIAAREGLQWGGVPSRSEAIRWLIGEDEARESRADSAGCNEVPKGRSR